MVRNEATVLTIEELQERWAWLYYEMGIEQLSVTEEFTRNGTNKFIVHNLTMELEDMCACCYDENGTILQNQSVLMMFLRNCLRSIRLIPIDGGMREILEFPDGNIFIEKVS